MTWDEVFNIIECGMGGQGTVLMSNIVGQASVATGTNVVVGEMHGLAQRSGSVIIHQRIGEDALSPLVPAGEADVILALDILEALRYLFYLKPGGTALTNSRLIHPPGESHALVAKKADRYVAYVDVATAIRKSGARLIEIDALGLAEEAGNALTENVVMVGALSSLPDFPLDQDAVKEGMRGTVPPKALAVNERAFELGAEACRTALEK